MANPVSGYWHFLCERLAEEHDIYVPKSSIDRTEEVSESGGQTCPVAKDWRSLFLELYALKDRFVKQTSIEPHISLKYYKLIFSHFLIWHMFT